jgi:hypothetical protein
MRVKGSESSRPKFTLAVVLVYGFSDLKRKQVLVLCPRNKLRKCKSCSGRHPKPFASLRDHFGDACRTALNHRNSGLQALRQSVILDAPFSIRLAPKMLNVTRKKALDCIRIMRSISGTRHEMIFGPICHMMKAFDVGSFYWKK